MGLSVPGSIASVGNGRKESRRRMDGREEEGILDDLIGLIRLLVPESGLTKSPKSPEAACYPLWSGWSVFTPVTESQATVKLQRENLVLVTLTLQTWKLKPTEVRNDNMLLLSLISPSIFTPIQPFETAPFFFTYQETEAQVELAVALETRSSGVTVTAHPATPQLLYQSHSIRNRASSRLDSSPKAPSRRQERPDTWYGLTAANYHSMSHYKNTCADRLVHQQPERHWNDGGLLGPALIWWNGIGQPPYKWKDC